MELTVKTVVLKDMVTKVAKGVSNNKLLPLTGMIGVELKDNKLTLTSSDGTNYLYVMQDKVDGDDFNITVGADIFIKLVSKTTSENISLSLENNILNVKGNGKYSIELELDENGDVISYPNPLSDIENWPKAKQIKHSTLLEMLSKLKPSLAVGQEMPQYTGYYAGDMAIATDTTQIAGMSVKLFDVDVLIAPEFLNLCEAIQNENIDAYLIDDLIIFKTDSIVVYGHIMEFIEDFAYDALLERIEAKFPSMCKLPTADLLQVLDRLSLFVTKYDNHGIQITFTKDGLMIASKAASGVEIIPYIESKKFKEFSAYIDIVMLTNQLRAHDNEVVEMWYGDDDCIKIVEDNTTLVLAYLGDEDSVVEDEEIEDEE